MITSLVVLLFRIYYFLIIVRILLSWAPVSGYNKWIETLYKITDPYLDIFKKFIPPIGMIDISPIVAIFALSFIENIILRLMGSIGIY